MPIESIVPDATTQPNPAWTGGLPHQQLDAADGNFISCATPGEKFNVSFGNLTSDIASINSIVFGIQGGVDLVRGVTANASFTILDSSDSVLYAAENKNFDDTTFATVQAGTTRTTSDGSTAWTESDVNGLRMQVKFNSITPGGGSFKLNFLKIDVDYVEFVDPNAGPYNNSANSIHIASGNISIVSGNIFI
tara:strand:- start:6675 stop:7250 length:576 start_codon:yes stop_codon:yes gene_type:complete